MSEIEGKPLLDVLSEMFPDSSKTSLRKMLEAGRIRVGGEIEKNAKRIIEPDERVDVGTKTAHRALPRELGVLHEDDDVIVVLKPHGLLTVATEREKDTTVQAWLNVYLKEKREQRVQVVHRLDRETSGVLVFAKNFEAREKLKEQFAAHSVDRQYVAVVEGILEPRIGTIRTYLMERRDLKMVSVEAHPDAKLAVTHYRVIAESARYSMLEVRLETGRKNQIRAHLSERGNPVLGDQMYGSTANPLGRLALHAKMLGFTHPQSGKRLTFVAPVPRAFRNLFGANVARERAKT
jgi:RluA family pseudouridine synthase